MIQEAYVSFETAKLLKEKGFSELTIPFYEDDGKFCSRIGNVCKPYDWSHESIFVFYSAPTQQMAMWWLREKYHQYIIVNPIFDFNDIVKWDYSIDVSDNSDIVSTVSVDIYDSYEDAVEAAIKYCLENLI